MASENIGSLTDCYVTLDNGKKALAVAGGGKDLNVAVQDQTTDPLIFRFNKITNSTTLASAITLFDRQITLADATGVAAGSYLIIFNKTLNKSMTCSVVGIGSSPIIDIDRPADYAFPSGSDVDITIVSMNQNGTLAEQVFGIRGADRPNSIPISIDINELRLFAITATVPTLVDFGDLTALTNGILIRKRISGGYKNIENPKSNSEILGAFGNWTPYIGTNPGIGINGFVGILKFNGQNNHGVAIRLDPGDDIEIVFNENLTGLTLFESVVIGHVVED